MSIDFIRPEVDELRPRISVIGVGGAGGNAIANMMRADVQGVDFVVANTDAQALNSSLADRRIQLGLKITQGLGAGSRPEIGRAAAEETLDEINAALEGAHMCFIAAGMGGGTGTGAAPVIAKAARDRGILTVGVCTKPFAFEGARRARSAEAGINELQQHVDTLIVIPNQNLFRLANSETTFKEAFEMADEVLQQGVRGITDLMVMPGLINLDFADVRSVMSEMGKAMMGTGEADGDNRAIEAAEKAISNPLLDGVSMKGAKGVIISSGMVDMLPDLVKDWEPWLTSGYKYESGSRHPARPRQPLDLVAANRRERRDRRRQLARRGYYPERKENFPGHVRGYDAKTGRCCGGSTSCPSRASSATTRGRATPGRTLGTSRPGRRCPRIRSAGSSSSRRTRPPTTTTAGTARRQPLRHEPHRPRREDRKARLALPDGPPRRLELRQPRRAAPPRHHGRRRKIPAVAAVTKQGFTYVFNRQTGQPVWPIEERPVPQSDAPGEKTVADAAVPDEARALRAPGDH